jgi:hypothetical protein
MVGVSADSMDIARGIGERDGEAFSDRPKTGVSDDPIGNVLYERRFSI